MVLVRLRVSCELYAYVAYISILGTNIDFARTYADNYIKRNGIFVIPTKLFTIWHDVGNSVYKINTRFITSSPNF
jgi:hypothetical protein